MRMKEPYEAYLDDYNCLDVYMSKNFFDGKSRIFHMKDTSLPIPHRQRAVYGACENFRVGHALTSLDARSDNSILYFFKKRNRKKRKTQKSA